MTTLAQNIDYYRETIRESLALTLANMNYYRTVCLQQAALFATWSYENARKAFHFAISLIQQLPAKIAQGFRSGYLAIREAFYHLSIILQAFPDFCWQLALTTYQSLKSAFLSGYELLYQMGHILFYALKDALNALVRNVIPGLQASWRLLKRTCLNIIDEIKRLPHYLYQALILTKEVLRIFFQGLWNITHLLVNTLQPCLAWIARKALLTLSKTVGFILGAGAALTDIAVDGIVFIFPFLGPLRAGVTVGVAASGLYGAYRGAQAITSASKPADEPKTAKNFTPGFQKTQESPPQTAKADEGTKKRSIATP